ncbi:hypothetical protein D039_1421B, partial [Vibrio parahaemolyticus EKP-028]
QGHLSPLYGNVQ